MAWGVDYVNGLPVAEYNESLLRELPERARSIANALDIKAMATADTLEFFSQRFIKLYESRTQREHRQQLLPYTAEGRRLIDGAAKRIGVVPDEQPDPKDARPVP